MGPTRVALLGGVVGPAAFVGAWAVGGLVADGYAPVDDAISRLAAVGANTRPLMTAGFLVFGAGMAGFAAGLRSVRDGPAWVAALAAGGCTAAVAAVPLDGGHDGLHGALAGAGYVALVAVPLLMARTLDRGRGVAVITAAVAGGMLAASVAVDGPNGLLQRLGLTLLDVWVAITAVRMARARRPTVTGA
jgi:hypothetical protein